jgi:hypothetical protein
MTIAEVLRTIREGDEYRAHVQSPNGTTADYGMWLEKGRLHFTVSVRFTEAYAHVDADPKNIQVKPWLGGVTVFNIESRDSIGMPSSGWIAQE